MTYEKRWAERNWEELRRDEMRWSVECEACSVKSSEWSAKCEVWSFKCDIWNSARAWLVHGTRNNGKTETFGVRNFEKTPPIGHQLAKDLISLAWHCHFTDIFFAGGTPWDRSQAVPFYKAAFWRAHELTNVGIGDQLGSFQKMTSKPRQSR
jgi:hypothetical protein